MAIGTISVSVIGSLTFLPATLAILGNRVDARPRRRVSTRRRGRADRAEFRDLGRSRWRGSIAGPRPRGCRRAGGFWGRAVRRTWVMARPVSITDAPASARWCCCCLRLQPALHTARATRSSPPHPFPDDGVAGIKLPSGEGAGRLTLPVVVTGRQPGHRKAAIKRLKAEAPRGRGLGEPVEVTPSAQREGDTVSPPWPAARTTRPTGRSLHRAEVLAASRRAPNTVGAGPRRRLLVERATHQRRSAPSSGSTAGAIVPPHVVAFHSIIHPDQGDHPQPAVKPPASCVLVAVFPERLVRGAARITPSRVVDWCAPSFTILLSMDYHLFHPDQDQGGPRIAGSESRPPWRADLGDGRRDHQRSIDHGGRCSTV